MHVNLLPDDYLAQQVLRRQALSWGAVVAVVVICGGAFYASNYLHVALLEKQVAEESSKHPKLQQMFADVNHWERQLANAQAEMTMTDQLRKDKRVLTLIGFVVRSTQNAGGKTRLQHLSVRLPSANAPQSIASGGAAMPGPPPAAEPQRGTLTIDGLADDANTISRFVGALEATGNLSQVNLKGSSENAAAKHCRQFQIECEF